MTSGSGRGTSIGQGERIECSHFHKYHPGTCRRITGGCFQCGSTYRLIVNCPGGSGSSRNPQGSSKGRSNVPPPTGDRGRGRGSSGQHKRSITSEIVNCPTTTPPARAYAMRIRKDQDTPGVIAGNFALYDTEMHALVDLGSTHSYICIEQLSDKLPSVEPLAYDMHVTSPLGHNVRVNRVYKNYPLMVHDREFSVYLIALPFHEFDLILGMDRLSKHWAIIDYDKKIVVLKCFDLSKVTVHGIRSGSLLNIIYVMQARRFLRKGCEAFLALVVNLENISVIKEFLDVFPKELLSLPPEREVDLAIKVLPGTTSISRAPYHRAPIELKELKTQL